MFYVWFSYYWLFLHSDCQKKNWKKHKAECIPQNKRNPSNNQHYHDNRDISIHLQQYLKSNYPDVTFMKTVRGCERLGRCLIAARNFKERDILFVEEPLESVPGLENGVYRTCYKCGSICSPNLPFSCIYCNCSYCSSDCMEADHERHNVFIIHLSFIYRCYVMLFNLFTIFISMMTTLVSALRITVLYGYWQ